MGKNESGEPWDFEWSASARDADEGMTVVSGVMDFVPDGRGNRKVKNRPLYLAAISFSYAVWENYVEDLADEITAAPAVASMPNQLPAQCRAAIENGATPWELAVDPGWRGLWVQWVSRLTKGSEIHSSWGLNTASKPNVDAVFDVVGIDPVPTRIVAPPGIGQQKQRPKNIDICEAVGTLDVTHALRQLIRVRGEAVHTASTTDQLYKNEVLWWADFVLGSLRGDRQLGPASMS